MWSRASIFSARSTAVLAASSACGEPSVASKIRVGRVLNPPPFVVRAANQRNRGHTMHQEQSGDFRKLAGYVSAVALHYARADDPTPELEPLLDGEPSGCSSCTQCPATGTRGTRRIRASL